MKVRPFGSRTSVLSAVLLWLQSSRFLLLAFLGMPLLHLPRVNVVPPSAPLFIY